ncbi:MAG: hypothetical protein ABSF26_21480 [Thermoguttaceae bacterium]|jgi:hypothetical protein
MVAFCRITKRMALARKLHPSRFTAMSGKMAAIVAHIIGQRWTSPAIVELVATSDGHLLACHEGDCGCNDYLGTVANLKSNWARLLEVAELTPKERQEADRLFQRVVAD